MAQWYRFFLQYWFSTENFYRKTPSEDVKKYFLATSKFGQEIQGEKDLYITNDRLNEASFRQKLDPILRNIIKNQNSIELLFKGVKHFDAQNLMIDFQTWEVDTEKKRASGNF